MQEDTLAPFLFIFVLDYALREATTDTSISFMLEKRLGCRKSTIFFTDQDFHDHLALLLNYMEQAQLFLQRLEIAGETIGLHIYFQKTEYMMFNPADTGQKITERRTIKTGRGFLVTGFMDLRQRKRHPIRHATFRGRSLMALFCSRRPRP